MCLVYRIINKAVILFYTDFCPSTCMKAFIFPQTVFKTKYRVSNGAFSITEQNSSENAKTSYYCLHSPSHVGTASAKLPTKMQILVHLHSPGPTNTDLVTEK